MLESKLTAACYRKPYLTALDLQLEAYVVYRRVSAASSADFTVSPVNLVLEHNLPKHVEPSIVS